MSKANRILLGVLVAQLAVIAGTKLLGGRQATVAPRKLLPELSAATLGRLEIADGEQHRVELAREGGQWVLASGGGYPVTQSKVTELIGKLAALTAAEPVSTQPQHQYALEVAADKFTRRVTVTPSTPGAKATTFFLGTSPGVKKAHFRFATEAQTYAASELSSWDVGSQPSDWIAPEYFKVERKDVVALTLVNANGKVEVRKGADGKWTLVDLAKGETVNESEIESLLGSATTINVDQPVGKHVEPAFGLDPPKALLTLVTETPAAPTPTPTPAAVGQPAPSPAPTAAAPSQRTFVLGLGAKDSDRYYAKSGQSPFVVKIASWSGDSLFNKKRADLLAKPPEPPADAKGKAGAAAKK